MGRLSSTCLASKGAYTCFDRTTGKPHPLPAPGLVAKNALCALLRSKVACRALDVGGDEFPGKALESLPPLPGDRKAVDWGQLGDGVAVLTASNQVFTWRLEMNGKPPEGWSQVAFR